MKQFIQEKLEEYDKQQTERHIRNIGYIQDKLDNVTINLQRIRTSTDEKEALKEARETNNHLQEISSAYNEFKHIKKVLGLMDDATSYDQSIKQYGMDYDEMYWKLLEEFDRQSLEAQVKEYKFVPALGSSEYCQCKGYYDIPRIEMGRLIKKDLQEEFPDIGFSVKTYGKEWWTDRADVKVTSIGDDGVVWFYDDLKLRDEFISAKLNPFVREYEPRIRVTVNPYL